MKKKLMTTMYVMQTGRTIWDEQVRVESAPGAPLTEIGQKDVQDAAKELAGHSISVIYASDGQAEQQTAHLVADAVGVKIRTRNDLRELDYGLWQGLTHEEIKRRQPKLFRQWQESPASVRPPGGESLDEARHRLGQALKDILKRHKDGEALVVLRPVAMGLVKCLVRQHQVDSLWQNVSDLCQWDLLEADAEDLNGS